MKVARPSSCNSPGEIMLPNFQQRDDDSNNGGEESVLSLNDLESLFTVMRKTGGGRRLFVGGVLGRPGKVCNLVLDMSSLRWPFV